MKHLDIEDVIWAARRTPARLRDEQECYISIRLGGCQTFNKVASKLFSAGERIRIGVSMQKKEHLYVAKTDSQDGFKLNAIGSERVGFTATKLDIGEQVEQRVRYHFIGTLSGYMVFSTIKNDALEIVGDIKWLEKRKSPGRDEIRIGKSLFFTKAAGEHFNDRELLLFGYSADHNYLYIRRTNDTATGCILYKNMYARRSTTVATCTIISKALVKDTSSLFAFHREVDSILIYKRVK